MPNCHANPSGPACGRLRNFACLARFLSLSHECSGDHRRDGVWRLHFTLRGAPDQSVVPDPHGRKSVHRFDRDPLALPAWCDSAWHGGSFDTGEFAYSCTCLSTANGTRNLFNQANRRAGWQSDRGLLIPFLLTLSVYSATLRTPIHLDAYGTAFVTGLIVYIVVIALQPIRSHFDADRQPDVKLTFSGASETMKIVVNDPQLRDLSLGAFAFGGLQSIFAGFFILFMIDGMDYSEAGGGNCLCNFGDYSGRRPNSVGLYRRHRRVCPNCAWRYRHLCRARRHSHRVL